MADLLDHNRLRKLHERAARTGSSWDREAFARAALEVVPELLAERDQLRAAREADAGMVTVCDACLRASCWNGEFFCDDYQSAGTVDLPVLALRLLGREYEDYWRDRVQPAREAVARNG